MSKPNITAYHRPSSLEEAWSFVEPGDPSVRLLSGGADLTIHAPPEVTTLVDVGRILDGAITELSDGTVRIGGMATLTAVMDHPTLAAYAGGVIPEMMVHVGNPLLRNFSTLGGHMARGKLSDIVPVLLALDAGITVFRGETATIPLAEYYDDEHNAGPHIVTELHVPPEPGRSAAAFTRFARTAFDFAILNACCRVDLGGEGVDDVRIYCGATPMRAQRAPVAERIITDSGLTEDAIAAAAAAARAEIVTGSGWVASAEYRSHLVEVLTRRCLTTAAERLEVTA